MSPSNDRDGDCTCKPPPVTDGPEEDCPQHGRPYSYWVERSDTLGQRLVTAERLRAEVELMLDRVLGTGEGDGAGAGFVADVQLAIAEAWDQGYARRSLGPDSPSNPYRAWRHEMSGCCCDLTTARLLVCPVHPDARSTLPGQTP